MHFGNLKNIPKPPLGNQSSMTLSAGGAVNYYGADL
jgi:hypothetical protein